MNDDDLPNANEESLLEITKQAKYKSAQVEKLLVDESLDDVSKAVFLLKNGTKLQKKSILENLPTLFEENPKNSKEPIIQTICDLLWKEDAEAQIFYGKLLVPIFAFLSPELMSKVFSLITTMLTIKNPAVVSQWEEVLYSCIPYVPLNIASNEIVKISMQRGESSESEKNRILGCRLFGALAGRLDSKTIEEKILFRIVNLCQDTSFSVRKTITEFLPAISKGIGPAKTKAILSTEIFQLVNDETKEVKQAALVSLLEILEFFDISFQKKDILPLFIKWMKHPPSDIYRILVAHFGKLFVKLSSIILEETTISAFAAFYTKMVTSTEVEVRQACAYNFPAVLYCIGAKRFSTFLSKEFYSLCTDAYAETRRTMAASFHEVSNLLGAEACSFMKDRFIQLLHDSNQEIQEAIVNNMYIIFQNFKLGHNSKDTFEELLPKVITYYHTLHPFQWSKYEKYFFNFQFFGDLFSNESLIHTILPLLKQQLFSGSIVVKQYCATAYVTICRKLESYFQQVELLNSLVEALKFSKNYRDRQTFVDICILISEMYSTNFFKEHIADHYFALFKDSISNVRRRTIKSVMQLQLQFILPNVASHNTLRIKELLPTLLHDKDRDVAESALLMKQELDQIASLLSRGGINFTSNEEADTIKATEEQKWKEAAKEQEKQKRKMELLRLSLNSVNLNNSGSSSATSPRSLSRINSYRRLNTSTSSTNTSSIKSPTRNSSAPIPTNSSTNNVTSTSLTYQPLRKKSSAKEMIPKSR